MVLLPYAPLLAVAASPLRNVTLSPNTNAVSGEVPVPGASTDTIKFLGNYSTLAGCQQACVEMDSCHSFTYHTAAFGPPFALGCYGRVDWAWHPAPQQGIVSGQVGTPADCTDDYSCSLNGVCGSDLRCKCDPAWTGWNCEQLRFVPGAKTAGYWDMSSWGGTSLRADDGKYHMWVAEMTHGCSVEQWLCNSRVTHVVADDGPLGSYSRREVVWPVFAHEPRTVRAPTGEFVMYWTGGGDGQEPFNVIPCTDGHQCDCAGGQCDGGRNWSVGLPTFMSWTKDPNGNWSKPVAIPQIAPTIDTNLSPVILEDGSVVGLFRNDGPTSNLHVVTATNWRDPSTYVEETKPPGRDGPEDPFVWKDKRGNFHALMHNWPHPTGVHLFSKTGKGDWRAAPADDLTGKTYGPAVTYSDGSTATLQICERPALVFAADGITPIGLTNGCGFDGQVSHTCLRPLNTR